MKAKTIVLLVVGGILALTFSVFGVLLFKFNRGADPNNEDAVLAEAKAASSGDDADRVEFAYRELLEAPPVFDFPLRGKLAVKRFIAAHFPEGKFSIAALGKLADLVMEDGVKDVDLVRVSLLAKMASNTLAEFDLVRAQRQFPDDKGIQLICEQQRRKNAEAGK